MATMEMTVPTTTDTLLVASDPHELAQAQHRMIAELGAKIDRAKEEARLAAQTKDAMVAARLSPKQAVVMHAKATARVTYLVKIKQALEAGYCMVPDMEGTVIAVRRNTVGPTAIARRERGSSWSVPDERGQGLPAGEGSYRSPTQIISHRKVTENDYQGKPQQVNKYWADRIKDPDGIDRKFMRPEVMNRTARALADRLFDEVVTVKPWNSQQRRNRDPIVLGRVVDTKNRTTAAFIIAWFIDTAEL